MTLAETISPRLGFILCDGIGPSDLSKTPAAGIWETTFSAVLLKDVLY
ncbi:hypothetical protein [Sphingobacterium griseoflavum]|nr:hypothetical protein [Sphingobacterium griseoflavum]